MNHEQLLKLATDALQTLRAEVGEAEAGAIELETVARGELFHIQVLLDDPEIEELTLSLAYHPGTGAEWNLYIPAPLLNQDLTVAHADFLPIGDEPGRIDPETAGLNYWGELEDLQRLFLKAFSNR